MPRIPRSALPAALALLFLDVAALATQPQPAEPALSAVAAPTSTTTAPAALPAPTTTVPAPPPTTAAPAAPRVTTAPPPRPSAPATTATPAPAPARASGKRVVCGWDWDAIRVDDGSSNEVTMTLSAPARPNETVTITAAFGGPDSPDASHTTTTDGAGQATAKFAVSEDKRDWTITISATFAAGGYCEPGTFTLDY